MTVMQAHPLEGNLWKLISAVISIEEEVVQRLGFFQLPFSGSKTPERGNDPSFPGHLRAVGAVVALPFPYKAAGATRPLTIRPTDLLLPGG